MFFIPLAILADLFWWKWADLRLRRFPRALLWRLLLALFMSTQTAYAISFLINSSVTRSARNMAPLPLHVSAFVWHLLVLPIAWMVVGVTFIARMGRGAHRKLRTPAKLAEARQAVTATTASNLKPHRSIIYHRRQDQQSRTQSDSPAVPAVSRRQLMMSAGAIALPPILVAGMSGAAFIQLGQFRVRHVELVIPSLPPDLHGLTIAQVSDIHIGKLTRPGMPQRIADAANAMGADLMIFSGDLIDYSLRDMPTGIDFIRRLSPRHGPECLVMIEGYHDLLEDGPSFERMSRSAGLPILIDEAQTIRVPGRQTPIQLLGLCWGVPDGVERLHMEDDTILASMERVMPLREPGTFPILLSHHPHAFDVAARAGLPLTLSGHTHGGQIMLTDHIGGGPIRFRYWTGLYRKGESQLFVNNGVGNWFPLRYNAPAEIVKLTLLQRPTPSAGSEVASFS
jgi:predicted MPP superfamily phosphohydrolase